MGDDLSDYEEQRLEIERKKLEALQGIKKALKRQSRMQSIHDLMDRMDVDRDDIETIAGLVASHIGSGTEAEEGEDAGLTERVAGAISAATGKNVEVEVDVEDDGEG